jgi:hypothetical protein
VSASKVVLYILGEHYLSFMISTNKSDTRAHTRGGGCRAAGPPPQIPENLNLKNTDFVDVVISKVLRDLPFRRRQPLKSADD